VGKLDKFDGDLDHNVALAWKLASPTAKGKIWCIYGLIMNLLFLKHAIDTYTAK
jgi:hypothetical protein